jgi:hypothetical protein
MFQIFLTQQSNQFPQIDKNTWFQRFQEDGAALQTARNSMNAINQLLPYQITSRNADIAWPARLLNSLSCDILLWGYLKIKVHAQCPQNTVELKLRI